MQIGEQNTLPTFEQPLDLLYACHEKVHRFAALAIKLADHVQAQGADGDAQSAAKQIMRYFDEAAPLHHQDEDDDLFPALRSLGDQRLNLVMAQIEAEHDELGAIWQTVRQWLSEIAQGIQCQEPQALVAFSQRYPAHAQREEAEIYPAARHLPAEVVAAIGQRMSQRRGAA